MEDRQPSPGQEGRVLITPEDSSEPFYATIAMADNPTKEGTPINKATLLSDTTAQVLGLNPTTGTVDQALKRLYDKKLALTTSPTKNSILYTQTENTIAQLEQASTDNAVLQQSKSGPPKWVSLDTLYELLQLPERIVATPDDQSNLETTLIDLSNFDWDKYKYARITGTVVNTSSNGASISVSVGSTGYNSFNYAYVDQSLAFKSVGGFTGAQEEVNLDTLGRGEKLYFDVNFRPFSSTWSMVFTVFAPERSAHIYAAGLSSSDWTPKILITGDEPISLTGVKVIGIL